MPKYPLCIISSSIKLINSINVGSKTSPNFRRKPFTNPARDTSTANTVPPTNCTRLVNLYRKLIPSLRGHQATRHKGSRTRFVSCLFCFNYHFGNGFFPHILKATPSLETTFEVPSSWHTCINFFLSVQRESSPTTWPTLPGRGKRATHSRHLVTKSINTVSLHRSAWDSVFEAGFRLRPLELVMHRGVPLESAEGKKYRLLVDTMLEKGRGLPKNNLLLVAVLMRSSGGMPRTSMIHANCSTSFSPGNNGYPVYSSASMHPGKQK